MSLAACNPLDDGEKASQEAHDKVNKAQHPEYGYHMPPEIANDGGQGAREEFRDVV